MEVSTIESNQPITQSLQHWEKHRSVFEFDGHEISYHVQGPIDAPCLLLIHGYPTASWDWHYQWPELVKHFRIFTLDMLGFGFSDKPQNIQYKISTQADIFTYFLQLFKVNKVHILSHDYGDTVAQELLARSYHGEANAIEVESLCLLNGGLFPETHKPVLLQKLLLSPIGPVISRLANYKKFKKNFDHICDTPLKELELKELWQLIEHNDGRPVMAKLIRYISERKLYRERWVGALQHTQIPLRLICGVEDPISGQHMIDRYKELIPEPDVISLAAVGHYPQLEQPQQVTQSFLEFHSL